MPPRDLNTHPVTNLERFLVTRYRNAHELLETDVDAAEHGLLSLLTEPRLPIWIRAQCNMLLAAITEEYGEAMRYLGDARPCLQLFRERHDEVTPRMLQMEKDLDGIEEEIEGKRVPVWERIDTTHLTSSFSIRGVWAASGEWIRSITARSHTAR